MITVVFGREFCGLHVDFSSEFLCRCKESVRILFILIFNTVPSIGPHIHRSPLRVRNFLAAGFMVFGSHHTDAPFELPLSPCGKRSDDTISASDLDLVEFGTEEMFLFHIIQRNNQ
jgi:hypothetical protein